jgi:LacI family transcriptional regulator
MKHDHTTTFNLTGAGTIGSTATYNQVDSSSYLAQNTWQAPTTVGITTGTVGSSFSYTFPAHSYTEITVLIGAAAQSGPLLVGPVTTAGTPIAGATVTTNNLLSATTDSQGYSRISAPVGTYSVTASASGYASYNADRYRSELGGCDTAADTARAMTIHGLRSRLRPERNPGSRTSRHNNCPPMFPPIISRKRATMPPAKRLSSSLKPQQNHVTGRAPVTLRDIASLVGISPSAVSMALADHPRISQARKDAVRAAASELGYVANSAGRALRAGRSTSIAVVVPNTGHHVFGHPYFMHLLVGVTTAANAHDSALLVSTNPDQTHGVAAYDRVLRSQAAAGAIIASAAISDPNVSRMVDTALPVVLIGRLPHLPQAVSVGVDEVAGAAAVTRHLVADHGLRRIGHISGPLEHQAALDRYDGFRAALAEADGPCTHTLAVGDFSEESGREGARQLLDGMSGLQAIFAANDEMAYGALLELRARGLRVPEDVALVGYDDFGVARITTPALTTVHVPAEDIGRIATERLFEIIGDPAAEVTHTVLPVEVVIRESCGTHPR